MTKRHPRDRDNERASIRTAADRLLAGTPLRSGSGKLTVTELLREADLRRDVVYADHKDLVEDFQARARARDHTPELAQRLAEQNRELKEKLASVTEELARERGTTAALRRLLAEVDLELHQARGLADLPTTITRLPPTRRARRERPGGSA
jgi:hypothetical protein